MREEVTPDINKANALCNMSKELLARVQSLPLEKFPSPNLSDLYDCIHMLLDAYLIRRGIKFRGDGAHIELIDEAKRLALITESECAFIQLLRDKRNKHKYEGFSVSAEFIVRNESKILDIIRKLHDRNIV